MGKWLDIWNDWLMHIAPLSLPRPGHFQHKLLPEPWRQFGIISLHSDWVLWSPSKIIHLSPSSTSSLCAAWLRSRIPAYKFYSVSDMLKLDVYMQLSFTLSLLRKTYIHLRYALSNVHLLLQKDVQLILSRPSCWASPWEPFPPKIGNSNALAIFDGDRKERRRLWAPFGWDQASPGRTFRFPRPSGWTAPGPQRPRATQTPWKHVCCSEEIWYLCKIFMVINTWQSLSPNPALPNACMVVVIHIWFWSW